jgi:hypothetical protein
LIFELLFACRRCHSFYNSYKKAQKTQKNIKIFFAFSVPFRGYEFL